MISRKKRRAVWDKTGGKCWYCGEELVTVPFDGSGRDHRRSFAVDHVVPRSRGGSNDLDNLLPVCFSCNAMKGNRTLEEFRWTVSCWHLGIEPPAPELMAWLQDTFGIDVRDGVPLIQFHFERQGVAA